MNRTSLQILVTLCILISLQCGKERNILFEIPVEFGIEIPAGLNPFDVHFFVERDIPTNLGALRRQFEVPDDQTVKVFPASAIIESLAVNQRLDFIQEVEISIFSGENPDDNTIAFFTDRVPANANTNIFIDPFDVDIAEDINRDKMNLRIKFRNRVVTPAFVQVRIFLRFSVE